MRISKLLSNKYHRRMSSNSPPNPNYQIFPVVHFQLSISSYPFQLSIALTIQFQLSIACFFPIPCSITFFRPSILSVSSQLLGPTPDGATRYYHCAAAVSSDHFSAQSQYCCYHCSTDHGSTHRPLQTADIVAAAVQDDKHFHL